MTLVWLLACSPCTGEVLDEAGVADVGTLDTLRATYAAWVARVGPDRVCVDRIVTTEEGRGAVAEVDGSFAIELDPTSMAASDLRFELCQALDANEGLSEAFEEVPSVSSFAWSCATLEPEAGWEEVRVDACGESALDPVERFLLERVYVHSPSLPAWSPLSTESGEARTVALPGAFDVAAASDHAVVLYREARVRLATVDPLTGVVLTDVFLTLELSFSELVGGTSAVLLSSDGYDAASDRVVSQVVPIVGGAASNAWSLYSDFWLDQLVVSDGVLYASDWDGESTELAALDLATGESFTVALPPRSAGADHTWVTRLAPAPGGVVAQLYDAAVSYPGDEWYVVPVSETLVHLGPDGSWIELPVLLSPVGTTTDGRLVGEVQPGPNTAFGTLDLADQTLALSGSVCPTAAPQWVVGDVAYAVELGEAVTFTPTSL